MANNNVDYNAAITIKQANGQPYDLTGATLEMQMKIRPGQTAAATFSTTGGTPNLVIRDPATGGIVDLSVPFTTMQGFQAGLYYWDLVQLISGSSRLLLGGGTWQITQGVTESTTPTMPRPQFYDPGPTADIALLVANDAFLVTLAPSGPPGTPSFKRISAVQTTSFTLDGPYDTWLVDASASDVTVTIPLGTSNPGHVWKVVRLDAGLSVNNHKLKFLPTSPDTLNGKAASDPDPWDLQGQYDNCTIENLSTVNGGQTWIIG